MQMQVEQGKGTADHLMPLGNWFASFWGKGGFSPSIHLYVPLSGYLSFPMFIHPSLSLSISPSICAGKN